MAYRRKFDGLRVDALQHDGDPDTTLGIGFKVVINKQTGQSLVAVDTPDGFRKMCYPGDWIIRHGDSYWRCPDDVFRHSYERVI
jgi:hypothetical protein